VSGLAADRTAIGDALVSLAGLTGATADLLGDARPAIAADVRSLGTLAGTLQDNSAVIGRTLDNLPGQYSALTGVASAGSWFNFYLCDFDGRLSVGGAEVGNLPPVNSGAARCTGAGSS
jgi:phospholipid/cholesterol/gamma-HCH transport system substrate-binding protein